MSPVVLRHVSSSLCENDPRSVWCFSRPTGEGIKVDPTHWYPSGSRREMEELANSRGFEVVGSE